MMRNKDGYTLIEMLLSIGILMVLLGITSSFYRPLYLRNELDVATHSLVLDLYRAQSLSRNGAKDSSWGVHVSSNSITLFRGTSYATRFSSDDEVYTLPNVVSSAGSTDYTFTQLSGVPTVTGTTILSVVGIGSKQIILLPKGVVNY